MRLFCAVRLIRFGLGLTLFAGTLPGAAALATAFTAPVTFEGRRGCGSERDAARITLTLRANATYVLRIILKGREQYEGMGLWNVDSPGQKLVLDSESERPRIYQLVDMASLKLLYDSKTSLSRSCFENLKQSAHIVDFSGQMRNVTLTSDLWTLETLGGKLVESAVELKPPSIAFDKATNRLAGSTGCHVLTGTYAQEGATSTPGSEISKLTIFPKTASRIACEPPFRETEARLLNALKRTAATHICCSTLELFDKRGTKLAGFRTTR